MIYESWSFYVFTAWVVIAIWLLPTAIAYWRKNDNTLTIFVMSVIFSVIPETTASAIGFVILMAVSLYKPSKVIAVEGPPGRAGLSAYEIYVKEEIASGSRYVLSEKDWLKTLKGKDADEIPLSKAGVVQPRKRT